MEGAPGAGCAQHGAGAAWVHGPGLPLPFWPAGGAEQPHWKGASSGWGVSLGHKGNALLGAALRGQGLIPGAISYP